jgi:class 3 adenylate cyclase
MDLVDNLVVLSSRVVPTKVAAEIGPSPWRGLLEHHIEVARLELARFGGKEVDATAYGFLASFEDPAAAISCADAIRRDVRGLGIEVGAGIHIGECNVRGDDVEGIAVDVAAQLDKVARPGEIVVSQAVRDSAADSRISFEERGTLQLGRDPHEWSVFTAAMD